MALHNDELNLAQQNGSTVRRAGLLGYLTDASVAAAGTKAGLIAAIYAVQPTHHDTGKIKILLGRVINYINGLTDANVASFTTVAQLTASAGFPVAALNTQILD